MPSIIKSQSTEDTLRTLLVGDGYILKNCPRGYGETGADIIAEKGSEKLFIEVIGFKSSPPARSKDFYESFFRAISRLKGDGANKCVIAMPIRAGQGMHARARQYGEAWARIGNTFPELEIWLVDIENNQYEKHTWNEWLFVENQHSNEPTI